MKKYFVMAALSLAALQPALAQEESHDQAEADYYAIEASQPEQAQGYDEQTYRSNAGEIIGGVIGGIIDAARDGRGGRGDWRDDRRGPGYGRGFVCVAQNARGQRFQARGPDQRWAQRRAMDECYRYSRRCQPLGCRAI